MAIELAPGTVIAGRYQLERPLGQGGMGVVWAAMHTVTRKHVALKFLRGPLHMRPELRRRFMREARAASAVVHPNVLEVHDVFELDDETPVMMMDLLQGETLGQRLTRAGKLSLSETADILVQVVSGVGTAHAVGVVHRDLKPDNVFLVGRDPPSVRVLDFGIAKLVFSEGPTAETGAITGTGAMLGTPCYMSPEQSFGERDIDHRSDVWAIGVIFYECLTGARPVEGDSIGQVVKRLVTDGITPITVMLPDLPPDISNLIDRMLCRERDGRPQDLREVSEILSRHTSIRAPEFGAATSEPAALPGAETSGPEHGVPTPPVHSAHDRVHAQAAPLHGESSSRVAQSASGPETAGAHTMASPKPLGRTSRALWIGGALVGASVLAIVTRSPSGSTDAASASGAASALIVPPVPSPVTATSTAEAKPEAPAPEAIASAEASAAPPSAKPGDRKTAAPAHSAAAHRPPSPAPSAAPAAAPPPAQPPKPRLGGLAEKPPF